MKTPDESGSLPQTEDVHVEIATAVAAEEDRDPVELPPLYDVVDPIALERLFRSTPNRRRPDGQVSFRYCGYRVSIDSQGNVSVE